MNDEIHLMSYAALICSEFEDLLERFDITIPDEDRTGEYEEAKLYGKEYSTMIDYITDILSELVSEVKANPDVEINTTEY